MPRPEAPSDLLEQRDIQPWPQWIEPNSGELSRMLKRNENLRLKLYKTQSHS